ncbi:MAG: ferredoxin--NADP reductase [Burkholderiales bacterium]|nr:ferredoxin--NADP reductase [Burkholderiales bacterium]MDE1926059.1 ferredoxin--NADP reductase [Burkholderiales bacterium]MDE2157687.1 ferredoxin--NADP reductase [Burkholderiales bacterium]MDE2502069.1 ferredoxin--NADP reductase [Burkholderiales bacterium]
MSAGTGVGVAEGYRRLRVAAIVDETADAKSIVFDLPPPERAAFAYQPGQFVTLRLPIAGQVRLRCYSMSSAPALDEGLRVTVKRVAGGRASNWICERLRVGDEVEMLPPAGAFTPRSLDGDFLLLAAGSGITPVWSILRSVLAGGSGRVALFYANRDERSVIFRAELAELAAAHPRRLAVVHWLDSVQGVPSTAQLAGQLEAWARPWPAARAYICGPAPFRDAACLALAAIGVADDAVHVERYASLPDEVDAGAATDGSAAAAAESPAAATAAPARVRLRLDGRDHEFDCRGGETLLDAAVREGIAAPHACRAGVCGACMCQLVEGQATMRHNEALDAKDLARGWILACQATPASAQLTVKYPG